VLGGEQSVEGCVDDCDVGFVDAFHGADPLQVDCPVWTESILHVPCQPTFIDT